jgi:murein L,D-transpeptidase YcbB/YkuD
VRFSAFLFCILFVSSQVMAQSLSPDHQALLNALENRLGEVNVEIENYNIEEALPSVTFGDGFLKVGQVHQNIPLLRAKLMNYGLNESFEADPHLYDDDLAEAVKKYQAEQGLRADGILGPSTLNHINMSLEDEKQQIEVNIHRLQSVEWMDRPQLRIEVDIARYWLKAYEDTGLSFEMPVVVGSPERPTNIFTTTMTGVRLNPGWTLPPTIKTEDYIPKLRENPQWVSERGVQIYTSWDRDAEPIDPTTVDWAFLTDNEIKAMRFYKNAGTSNPLGQYRFLMNNKYDIYLHDTNKKYLFDRAGRARSSGCVRVSDPRRIVEFLLKDDTDWTSEKLDEVMVKNETTDLGAKRSIAVYFDYKTAWLNGAGKLVLGHDIYDLDADSYRDMIEDVVINDGNSQKTLVE